MKVKRRKEKTGEGGSGRRVQPNLAVGRPCLAVKLERLRRRRKLVRVEQVRADHRPGAPLARLAVHRDDVARVGAEPGVLGGRDGSACAAQPYHVLAERLDELEARRVVVLEREDRDAVVELRDVVRPLLAQVVDLVVVLVLRLEEPAGAVRGAACVPVHLGQRVAVHRLHVLGREPHGDDPAADVCGGAWRL